MEPGRPDPEPLAPPPPTLAARLSALWRSPPRDREVAAAVAVLIALGPLATIAGAQWLTADARSEAARLRSEVQPRLAAELAAERARSEVAALLARPAMAGRFEALARALPADASLTRAEQTDQGAFEIDVATPDPDRLRAMLRRDPALSRMRDVGQRQSDAAMIVSLRDVSQ